MSRQAVDTLWLTLESGSGETTRMGVTSEHPMFAAGEGWVTAGELVAGDAIRDAQLRKLTGLTTDMTTKRRVGANPPNPSHNSPAHPNVDSQTCARPVYSLCTLCAPPNPPSQASKNPS